MRKLFDSVAVVAVALFSIGAALIVGCPSPSAWPAASAHTSAQVAIPSGAATAIAFDVNDYSTGGVHTSGASVFTAPSAGLYHAKCGLVWATSNTAGIRVLAISKNGTAAPYWGNDTNYHPFATGGEALNAESVLSLSANDTIQCLVLQNSGAPLSALDGPGNTYGQLVKIK